MAPFFKPGSELYRRFYTPTLDPITTSIGEVGGSGDIAGPLIADPTGYLDPVVGFASQQPQMPVDPGGGLGALGGAIENLGRAILPQFFQNDQVNTGITVSGSQFPGRCATRRRKLKIVVGADGQPHVIAACPPRRMNPLNARALGRAARRLGMFHNIAQHIEKQVQHACRSGIGRRRLSSPRSCGPKRRCR